MTTDSTRAAGASASLPWASRPLRPSTASRTSWAARASSPRRWTRSAKRLQRYSKLFAVSHPCTTLELLVPKAARENHELTIRRKRSLCRPCWDVAPHLDRPQRRRVDRQSHRSDQRKAQEPRHRHDPAQGHLQGGWPGHLHHAPGRLPGLWRHRLRHPHCAAPRRILESSFGHPAALCRRRLPDRPGHLRLRLRDQQQGGPRRLYKHACQPRQRSGRGGWAVWSWSGR